MDAFVIIMVSLALVAAFVFLKQSREKEKHARNAAKKLKQQPWYAVFAAMSFRPIPVHHRRGG
jgi:hypothetical protein